MDKCSGELLGGGEEFLFQAEESLSLVPDERQHHRLGGSDWALVRKKTWKLCSIALIKCSTHKHSRQIAVMPLPSPSQFFLRLRRPPHVLPRNSTSQFPTNIFIPLLLLWDFAPSSPTITFASQKYSWEGTPTNPRSFGHEKPGGLRPLHPAWTPSLAAHICSDTLFLCHLCTNPKCSFSCSALHSQPYGVGCGHPRGVRNILYLTTAIIPSPRFNVVHPGALLTGR